MSHRLLPFSPARYHGKPSSRPYFEGWYFKQSSNNDAFAVIPGVFRSADARGDTAFIQVIFGTPPQSFFVPYPPNDFFCHPRRFELRIGGCLFTMNAVKLDLPQIGLAAEFDYRNHVPIKRGPFSPSIMGPFSYLPAMQCNHGVLSLWQSVSGEVRFGEQLMMFDNADGYMEKDWGESFPESWIWMQCGNEEAALMCAVASIPFRKFSFIGVICALNVMGHEYRFATYNGAHVLAINRENKLVTVEVGRGKYRLCIIARNTQFGTLKAPTKTGMDREIEESLSAVFDVSLCHGTQTLFSGHFDSGGLEMLNPERLYEKNKRR